MQMPQPIAIKAIPTEFYNAATSDIGALEIRVSASSPMCRFRPDLWSNWQPLSTSTPDDAEDDAEDDARHDAVDTTIPPKLVL